MIQQIFTHTEPALPQKETLVLQTPQSWTFSIKLILVHFATGWNAILVIPLFPYMPEWRKNNSPELAYGNIY